MGHPQGCLDTSRENPARTRTIGAPRPLPPSLLPLEFASFFRAAPVSITERALCSGLPPPSFSSNCYVKIPRTCFCKELKEGEEEIVFVGVSLSL